MADPNLSSTTAGAAPHGSPDSSTLCSELSAKLGEPMAGTADTTPGVLLLEHPGPWPQEALACLPNLTRSAVQDSCALADLRPGLIRRHQAAPGSVSQPTLVLGVPEEGGMLVATRLSSHDALTDMDLPEIADQVRDGEIPAGWQPLPYLMAVCVHGRCDACCGHAGGALIDALLPHEPQLVWETSHLGGHRFAATALALPQGVVYGRLTEADAPRLLKSVRTGHLLIDHLRGRLGLAPAVQVAEIEVRARTGVSDVGQVILLDELTIPISPERRRTVTEWEINGDQWTVVVDEAADLLPPRALSCRASGPQSTPSYRVVAAHQGSDALGSDHWDSQHDNADPDLPDPTVLAEVADLPGGAALDLACGTGRHALWLASHGWQVRAVDFSSVAMQALAERADRDGLAIQTETADLRTWTPPTTTYDLIVMSFVHLSGVFDRAVKWLAPGGCLVLVGHAQRNLSEGVGGPNDPRVLHDPVALAARATGARLRVLRAQEVSRHTDEGTAIDAVLVATKPAEVPQPVRSATHTTLLVGGHEIKS